MIYCVQLRKLNRLPLQLPNGGCVTFLHRVLSKLYKEREDHVESTIQDVKSRKRVTPTLCEEETAVGYCPYYKRERTALHLQCEGGHLRFADKLMRREFVYGFCAHPEGHKTCAMKQALDHYYERKYQTE